jgi:Fe-S-cluster containining protein
MAGDAELIQIVDAAMAEAVRRSGSWIACRPGCFECCIGPFAITAGDAERLRAGLAELEERDPARAERVRERARDSAERLSRYSLEEIVEDDDVGAEELCPALDPEAGTCDLYASRPVTCRTFGPAVRVGDGSLAVCELCYDGATDEEIAACVVTVDAATDGGADDTIVALALLKGSTPARSPASI